MKTENQPFQPFNGILHVSENPILLLKQVEKHLHRNTGVQIFHRSLWQLLGAILSSFSETELPRRLCMLSPHIFCL